jgi:hypothetical protein
LPRATSWPQPCQRRFVTFDRLAADGLFERRKVTLGFESGDAGLLWPPTLAPQLLPDAVENGLPQVGVQRPGTPGFELPDPLKRLKEGFLDKVIGIGHVCAYLGQSAGSASGLMRPE